MAFIFCVKLLILLPGRTRVAASPPSASRLFIVVVKLCVFPVKVFKADNAARKSHVTMNGSS